MEQPNSDARMKSVAGARLAKLKVRANALRGIVSLSHFEDITLRYHGACADRNRYEASSERDLSEIRGRISNVTAAVSHARGGATVAAEPRHIIDSGEAELAALDRQLTAALVQRAEVLEPLSKRAESLDVGRELARRAMSQTMADLGISVMEIGLLVKLADLPGLDDLTALARPAMREKRAATILQCAVSEVMYAEIDLLRVGKNVAFDAALYELIEAEMAHESARREEIEAARTTEMTNRRLGAAQRARDQAAKKLPGDGQAAMGVGTSDPSPVSAPEALSRSVDLNPTRDFAAANCSRGSEIPS